MQNINSSIFSWLASKKKRPFFVAQENVYLFLTYWGKCPIKHTLGFSLYGCSWRVNGAADRKSLFQRPTLKSDFRWGSTSVGTSGDAPFCRTRATIQWEQPYIECMVAMYGCSYRQNGASPDVLSEVDPYLKSDFKVGL